MSGWVNCIGPCICCGQIFSFNPHRVPSSTAITGQREPICRTCMDRLNAKRRALGLEPFHVAPDAYDPIPEEEL